MKLGEIITFRVVNYDAERNVKETTGEELTGAVRRIDSHPKGDFAVVEVIGYELPFLVRGTDLIR